MSVLYKNNRALKRILRDRIASRASDIRTHESPSAKQSASTAPAYALSADIPEFYNDTYMRAIPKDPVNTFIYWEIPKNNTPDIGKMVVNNKNIHEKQEILKQPDNNRNHNANNDNQRQHDFNLRHHHHRDDNRQWYDNNQWHDDNRGNDSHHHHNNHGGNQQCHHDSHQHHIHINADARDYNNHSQSADGNNTAGFHINNNSNKPDNRHGHDNSVNIQDVIRQEYGDNYCCQIVGNNSTQCDNPIAPQPYLNSGIFHKTENCK